MLHLLDFCWIPAWRSLKLPWNGQRSAKQIAPGTANMKHRDNDTHSESVLWFGAGEGEAAKAFAESQG